VLTPQPRKPHTCNNMNNLLKFFDEYEICVYVSCYYFVNVFYNIKIYFNSLISEY
jgi:hypothetical protein